MKDTRPLIRLLVYVRLVRPAELATEAQSIYGHGSQADALRVDKSDWYVSMKTLLQCRSDPACVSRIFGLFSPCIGRMCTYYPNSCQSLIRLEPLCWTSVLVMPQCPTPAQ